LTRKSKFPPSCYLYKMNTSFKKIEKLDYPFLKEMLYEGLFVPEGMQPFPITIIDLPEISKYIINWNDKKDFGLIALIDNKQIGAIWCRLFTEENKGYGFVDINTPELSMAIIGRFRNHGIGTELLTNIFIQAKEKGFKSLSLSVDKRNRACSLYKRLGFEIIYELETAYTMKKEL
jgi:[ribosomal protein S18]-alanine N-acetyltransferase